VPHRPAERLALALILALSLTLAFLSQRGESVTVDEYAHLAAGCASLRHGELALYAKTPPLVRYFLAAPALLSGAVVPLPTLPTGGGGWDPWLYGDAFLRANAGPVGLGRYPVLLQAGRLAGIGLGFLLLVLLYGWSRRLHGPAGGLTSLFLLALSPTFLAHTKLATVDIGATLAIFLATWLAWRALVAPSTPRWALAGAGLGVAVAAKFTAVLLLPVFVVWWGLARWAGFGRGDEAAPGRRALRRLGAGLALAAAFTLVVHGAYQFQAPLSRLDEFRLFSRLGGRLSAILPGWTPVPAPAAMVRGMDGQLLDLEQPDFPNYLNGGWSREGWWYYYPEALLLKTPLALPGLRRRRVAAGGPTTVGGSAGRRRPPAGAGHGRHDARGAAPGLAGVQARYRCSLHAAGLSVSVPAPR